MKTIKLSKAILLLAICFSASIMFAQSTTPKWAKTFNNTIVTTAVDFGRAVTTDASGNVYVTGEANYNSTDYEIATIKYNSSGGVVWTTTVNIGNPTNCPVEAGFAIAVDGSGNVWVAASAINSGGTNDVLALIKYNSSGTVQTNYPKRYGGTNCSTVNGTGGFCIAISGSSVYIGGSAYIGTTWSFIVLKDTIGANWGWNNTPYTHSGSNTAAEHRATDIKVSGGYVYATGFIANTSVGKDVFTVKLDSGGKGAVQTGWPQTYNGNASGDDVGNALSIDPSGNYIYVAGYATRTSNGKDGFLTKYDIHGSVQSGFPALYDYVHYADSWSDIETVSGTGNAPAVYVGGYRTDVANADYSLMAYTNAGVGASGTGYWSAADPVHYDGAYASGTEASGTDCGYGIEYSATTNRIYITGMADEGTNPTHDINITTIGYDATTGAKVWGEAKYDMNTDALSYQADENYWKYGFKVDYNGGYCVDDIYVEGASYVSGHNFDYITLKYSCGTCVGCQGPGHRTINNNQPENITSGFYPNPFSKTANLSLEDGSQITNAVLSIYDITGRLVTSIQNISSTTIIVDRGALQSGLYFYKLSENGNILSNGKFIIAD